MQLESLRRMHGASDLSSFHTQIYKENDNSRTYDFRFAIFKQFSLVKLYNTKISHRTFFDTNGQRQPWLSMTCFFENYVGDFALDILTKTSTTRKAQKQCHAIEDPNPSNVFTKLYQL